MNHGRKNYPPSPSLDTHSRELKKEEEEKRRRRKSLSQMLHPHVHTQAINRVKA
jgi:hypothetical protein